ncbi:MAG: hypothetical protein ACE5JR_10450 [Gemmatimonadota bacterium]
MGFRKFVDREGSSWEVRPVSDREWRFEPLPGNRKPRVSVRAPGYERDPFELSVQELQRLLDGAGGQRGQRPPSPFKD